MVYSNQNETTERGSETELKELADLKEAYKSLKMEVERLREPEEGQASMRAISLRILQNEIESCVWKWGLKCKDGVVC